MPIVPPPSFWLRSCSTRKLRLHARPKLAVRLVTTNDEHDTKARLRLDWSWDAIGGIFAVLARARGTHDFAIPVFRKKPVDLI